MPEEMLIWQDLVPPVDLERIDTQNAATLASWILDSGVSSSVLVRTARASTASDRGPGNRRDFNASQTGDKRVSLADLIVLGGSAAIEKAAKDAGGNIEVPFAEGCTDASREQTDVESFAVLEPTADGFRNYIAAPNTQSPAELLVARADFLTLTVPEMTVSIGGMRALDVDAGGVQAFVREFLAAWAKVMTLDRFDLEADGSRKSRPGARLAGR